MGLDLVGIGSIADLAKGLVDRFLPPAMTGEQKAQAQIQMQEILEKRETTLIDAQKSIIVSEMQQSDNFAKRARPSLVYSGLLFIFLVHVAFPIVAFFTNKPMPSLILPTEFWYAWTGVCSAWIIGRSAEKKGATGSVISLLTGNK